MVRITHGHLQCHYSTYKLCVYLVPRSKRVVAIYFYIPTCIWRRLRNNIFSRYDRTPVCMWQTDERTESQSIYRTSIALREKFVKWHFKICKHKYRQCRELTVIHTCRSYAHSPRADSPADFGLLRSKVLQNWRFPAQDAEEPLCKIWRR